MKKKKLKKLLKQARKTLAEILPMRRRRPVPPQPSPEILTVMQKVKQQLEDIKKPVAPEYRRNPKQETEITISEYLMMDRTLSMMQVHPRLYS